jgi:hypothetical protein
MGTMKRVPNPTAPDPAQQETMYIEEDRKISMWKELDMYFCGPESRTAKDPVLYSGGDSGRLIERSTRWTPQEVKQATCKLIHMTKFISPYNSIIVRTDNIDFFGGYAPTQPPPFHEKDSPSTECLCGIHGFKHDFPPNSDQLDRQVISIVEIWGKIISTECTYRAQYARIRALVELPPTWNEVLPEETIPYITEYFDIPSLPSMEYAQKEFFL